MEPQKPTKAIRKDQVWFNRSIHLRTHIDSLGLKKTQQLDAHELVKVFFFCRSLRLKLTDTYLAKVWQMSFISTITYKDGKVWKQETVSEPLDYDPSERPDWNWKDYE